MTILNRLLEALRNMMPWCNLRWHLPLPHQSCVLRWIAVFCDVTRLVLGVLGNAMLTWAGVVGGGRDIDPPRQEIHLFRILNTLIIHSYIKIYIYSYVIYEYI